MKVLLAQLNPTVGALEENRDKIIASIQSGKKAGAALIVLPELALCGYPPEDFLLLPHFIADVEEALESLISLTSGITVIVGTVRRNSGRGEKPLFNSAAVISDGELLGFQDKRLLPTYDVFDERRFFEEGKETAFWMIEGKHVAVTICEDIWQHSDLLKYAKYPHDPIRDIASMRVDCVVNLSASPFSMNKFEERITVCCKAAAAAKAPILLCNQVGGNDSLVFDGRSLYVDAQGVFAGCAKGFAEDDLLIDLEVSMPAVTYSMPAAEQLFQALVLGVRDYFSKSGFSKACLGLSGGIDSAVTAAIAVEALGKENVLGVLLPSRYSSEGSVSDAKQLAATLGIATHEISIEGPFRSYLETLKPYLQGNGGLVEENIQARIRGMLLMALSNQFGYIVLSTGNKSELAMGYSTLYGDLCGGLAVVSDVTKQQVYALANWINRQGIVVPENTISKPPSAELRANQKDTDTLPDYVIIDNVLQAYIEEHEDPPSIAVRYGYAESLVNDLVSRIHGNEYKRRQAPPGLRISQKAFSIGRRFPIVQGYVKGSSAINPRE